MPISLAAPFDNSRQNTGNRLEFLRTLKRLNPPPVVKTFEAIVEWLPANGFGLWWHWEENITPQLRIGVVQDADCHDSKLRIAPCSSKASPHAVLRFYFRSMTDGPYRFSYMKYVLQKKVVLEGFPIHCGAEGEQRWDKDYFEFGAPHIYLADIDIRSIPRFFDVMEAFRDLYIDEDHEPADWDRLIDGCEF